ncbi:DELLA protein RGL1-like isoform X2 [Tripterygium wilfordii]|nr:DELLA protein RGL1-like isoform X2 [Tripterygium wilfordii]
MSVEGGNAWKKEQVHKEEDWGQARGTDSLGSDYGSYEDDGFIFSKYLQQERQLQAILGYGLFDNLRFDVFSPALESCMDEIADISETSSRIQDVVTPEKEKRYPQSLASLQLLTSHGRGFKRLNGGRIIEPSSESICMKESIHRLSTVEIMKVAGQRFIQSFSEKVDVVPLLNNPFDISFSGISKEEMEDVELVDILLAAAEKVCCQEFELAIKFLSRCDRLSSINGNPVQRVAYYFSEALREKIDQELKGFKKEFSFDMEQIVMDASSASLAHRQEVPFCQVEQFAGIQAIIENVAEAKKVHIIDLGIKCGVQWTLLMQALASRHECTLELLKITAVGFSSSQTEVSGKRLMGFAQSMNLPFSFRAVIISDILDLKEDQFELDTEETVAFYSEFFIFNLIAQPDHLDYLMGVIRNINPCIMVVTEVEANLNSPAFVSRFIEGLFFYGAYFDCIDACMERYDKNRINTEKLLNLGIRSLVVADGNERRARHVKIDVWRAFFSRFRMEEKDLSMSSLYQADLMVKNFARARSCTLDMNGKSLIVGWMGTPIHSLSVWKFL